MHVYPPAQSIKNQVLSVTELNNQARRLLEISFNNIRVEGEISGLSKPRSGHWYFTLKDAQAQIRCAMFRNRNQSLKISPCEGMLVEARGQISLYANRGDYQLIVENMLEAGSGALQKAFEELKKKLSEEGLFDDEAKRDLPRYPKHVGVITSPTGAAIRDILSVLKRRSPFIDVTIIPSIVQGEAAAGQLINSLQIAKKTQCDVIIIGRGGGSIEDLWPFNQEALARAIAEHPVPVISAVGHETDFTIADYVADYRAATPSAAAEILSRDRTVLIEKLQLLQKKIVDLTHRRLLFARDQVNHISKRLRHPGDRLREYMQRLDDMEMRLKQVARLAIERKQYQLQYQQNALQRCSPITKIEQMKLIINHQSALLQQFMHQKIETCQALFRHAASQIHAISPLATLSRGYSITRKDQRIITGVEQLQPGDRITTVLNKGSVSSTVDTIAVEDAIPKLIENVDS